MRHAIALAFLFGAAAAAGQQPWSVGARGHYGFLWAHRSASWILVEGHAGATELHAERRVAGHRPWHRAYALPSYGFIALHTRMANPARIGDAAGLLPYLALPLAQGPRLALRLRLGWGVGWVSRPYDRLDNNRQIAIGSRLNTAIQLMPELRWARGRTAITAAVGLDHWSNGSAKQPNLGLNFLSAALGASYALRPASAAVPAPDTTAYERAQRELSVVGALGLSESGRPLNGQRTVLSLSAHLSWRKGRKGALGAGVDLFNKGDLPTVHAELAGKPRAAFTQLGIHAGGALLFGRAELLLHFGAYALSPVPDDAPVYQRIGARYRIGRHLLAGISLKTHFAAADHWELGLGYRWP